jgi:hypothetical protein
MLLLEYAGRQLISSERGRRVPTHLAGSQRMSIKDNSKQLYGNGNLSG